MLGDLYVRIGTDYDLSIGERIVLIPEKDGIIVKDLKLHKLSGIYLGNLDPKITQAIGATSHHYVCQVYRSWRESEIVTHYREGGWQEEHFYTEGRLLISKESKHSPYIKPEIIDVREQKLSERLLHLPSDIKRGVPLIIRTEVIVKNYDWIEPFESLAIQTSEKGNWVNNRRKSNGEYGSFNGLFPLDYNPLIKELYPIQGTYLNTAFFGPSKRHEPLAEEEIKRDIERIKLDFGINESDSSPKQVFIRNSSKYKNAIKDAQKGTDYQEIILSNMSIEKIIDIMKN